MHAFGSEALRGEKRVGHIDGDTSNCEISNLYWIPATKKQGTTLADIESEIERLKEAAAELRSEVLEVIGGFDYYRESRYARERYRVLDSIVSRLESIVRA
jgi:MinD-like ATPase involved in chromosome partitioning or flagellar assembly